MNRSETILTKDQIKKNKLNMLEGLPKTVIIGANGFLGSRFTRFYRQFYLDSIGCDKFAAQPDIYPLDLLAPNIAPLKLSATGHKEALIVASITNIDECEGNPEITRKVNVAGTLELIRQLVAEGIKPVFASTSQVFDGQTGNYSDDSVPHPINEYGRQKAEVEKRIGEISQGNYLVIRLGKVFSLENDKSNFLGKLATDLKNGKVIRAASDHIVSPVLVDDLIEVVAYLQVHRFKGIINVCPKETFSIYDMALALAKAMQVDVSQVQKVAIDEIGLKTTRPKNNSLFPDKLLLERQLTFTPLAVCINTIARKWKDN